MLTIEEKIRLVAVSVDADILLSWNGAEGEPELFRDQCMKLGYIRFRLNGIPLTDKNIFRLAEYIDEQASYVGRNGLENLDNWTQAEVANA